MSQNCAPYFEPFNHHDATADGGMGLRAASHVSMPDTMDAHEYQPTCPCPDCSTLLHQFTQYDLLDAYVAHHLPYEAAMEKAYGYIPCVGSPRGNVLVHLVTDEESGEAREVYETSNALFFHFHLHEMRPVPAEVRHRSLARFHEAPVAAAGVAGAAHQHPRAGYGHGGHGHGGAAHHNHQHSNGYAPRGGAHNAVTPRRGNGFRAAAPAGHHYGYAAAPQAAPFAPEPQYAAAPEPKRFATHAAAAPHFSNGGYGAAPYTQRDAEFVARSTAFSSAAHLGCG